MAKSLKSGESFVFRATTVMRNSSTYRIYLLILAIRKMYRCSIRDVRKIGYDGRRN